MFNKIVGLKDSWAKKTKIEDKAVEKVVIKQEAKKETVVGVEQEMSESQKALFEKYTNNFRLNNEVSNILARDEELSKFYEEALAELNSPITIANIVANDVAKELKQSNELKFDAKQIAQLVKMIDEDIISNKIAKQVFEEMVKIGVNPNKIVEDKGLVQITDVNIILPIIDEVMAKNPDNVAKYKAGNDKLFGFFVGQVLKATDGKANPKVVNDLVIEKLNS